MDDLAKTQTKALTAQDKFSALLEAIPTRAAIVTAALTGIGVAASRALGAFAENEQAIFRTTIILRNLGRGSEVDGIVNFSRELANLHGTSENASIGLAGLLARFKLTDAQIRKGIPVIQDFAGAVNIDVASAADKVVSSLRGEQEAIQAFGIVMQNTGDLGKDYAKILELINERFRGGAAAQRETLTGRVNALTEAMRQFNTEAGGRLNVGIGPTLDAASESILNLTKNFDAFLTAFGSQGAIQGFIADLLGGTPGANPATKVGSGRGGATEDTAKKIEQNTRAIASAALKNAFGGPGTAARDQGAIRILRSAFRGGAV